MAQANSCPKGQFMRRRRNSSARRNSGTDYPSVNCVDSDPETWSLRVAPLLQLPVSVAAHLASSRTAGARIAAPLTRGARFCAPLTLPYEGGQGCTNEPVGGGLPDAPSSDMTAEHGAPRHPRVFLYHPFTQGRQDPYQRTRRGGYHPPVKQHDSGSWSAAFTHARILASPVQGKVSSAG